MDAEAETLLFDDVDGSSAAGDASNEREAADVGSLAEPIAPEGETGPARTPDTTSPLVLAQADAEASLLTSAIRAVVTNQAMGARCAVAADFDSDGRMDLVSASSNDNAVSWYKNLGNDSTSGRPTFSIKKPISWSSNGSRIVTVADIDQDGHIDVIGASYYDNSLRWFRNVPQIYNNEDDPNDPKNGSVEGIKFEENLISDAVNEGQGVTVADLDNDGDPDIITASSGDNTIAVFKNIDKGTFCEIKEVVDSNAKGARTVVAADLNGDGLLDLASASKDDDTVAWYPNTMRNVVNHSTGATHRVGGYFDPSVKNVISNGTESTGAYSLVAADVDLDGDQDLVVASNGNDHVSLWRNDGKGNFEKTLIYDNADFVLSVTALDIDRDGDIDVASASFYDGHINWYENVDGQGYEWKNHTVYVGIQGHYVSHGDMDGDGDEDLIAAMHAENTVSVYFAQTPCDDSAISGKISRPECCHEGSQWDADTGRCLPCKVGFYGVGSGLAAECVACPTNACTVGDSENSNSNLLPATCSGIAGCADPVESIAQCSCGVDQFRDNDYDVCALCPQGQIRPDLGISRPMNTLGNYSLWEDMQGTCRIKPATVVSPLPLYIIIPVSVIVALLIFVMIYVIYRMNQTIKYRTRDVNNAPTTGLVGLLFTDVEGSTALWDEDKTTMSAALDIHHDVIRKVIDRYSAYEVKTIGDSFMIAVKCPDTGAEEGNKGSCDKLLHLANDIQQDLLHAEWPVELANMPTACTEFTNVNRFEKNGDRVEPKLTFRGLRVRIGVHVGVHSDRLSKTPSSAPSSASPGGDELSASGNRRQPASLRRSSLSSKSSQNSSTNDEDVGDTLDSISYLAGSDATGVKDTGGKHEVQVKYDVITKGYDYYGPATNCAARVESLAFGGQTLMSAEVSSRLSDECKKECLIQTVGGVTVKGVTDEVFLYSVMPRSLSGRSFRGVYRRRESDGGSILTDEDSIFRRGSHSVVSIDLSGQRKSPKDDAAMTSDVSSMTPVQLMTAVLRLRNKCRNLEYALEETHYQQSKRSLAVGVPVDRGESTNLTEGTTPENSGSDSTPPQDDIVKNISDLDDLSDRSASTPHRRGSAVSFANDLSVS
mmetsp:Transcript_16937/g.39377  ORF Transcript_16937/g.39377 Transcript_16937/m.39377 type:complete len:1110 (-) Transcript_16937:32-3361(-)